MATITATILVGSAHSNHGGIQPSHQLTLSENSRPAWTLAAIEAPNEKAAWIPTVEDMLEDGLLMAGLLAIQDEALQRAAAIFKSDFRKHAQLYDDVSAEERLKLYQLCRKIRPTVKLVISVFEGSSLKNQLAVLEQYQIGVELCLSVFRREHSNWSGKVEVSGTIPS